MVGIIRPWADRPWHHFNVRQKAGFDNAPGLTDMFSQEAKVMLPPGTFEVQSAAVTPANGSHVVGAKPFGNVRPADDAEFEAAVLASGATRLKYVGPAVANSAVLRFSKVAIGADFVSTLTDDLFNCWIDSLLLDANNLADFGFFGFRCGNGTVVRNIAGARSKKCDVAISGAFSADIQGLFSTRAQKRGIAIGRNWFSYSQFGWTANRCSIRDLRVDSAGLSKAWNFAANKWEGSLCLSLGRGNDVSGFSVENCDNPMVIEPTNIPTGAGSTALNLAHNNRIGDGYIENVGADQVGEGRSAVPYGLMVKLDYYGGGTLFHNAFLHPGSALPAANVGLQAVAINETNLDDWGQDDPARQFTFWKCGPGASIISNTAKFRAVDCAATILYPDRAPALTTFGSGAAGGLVQTKGPLTFTIVGETTAGTHAPGSNGRHVTTGDLVEFSFDIDMTTFDGTGPLKIIGLPRAAAAQTVPVTIENWRVSAAGTNFRIYGRIAAGATEMTLYKDVTDGTVDQTAVRLTEADLSGTAGSYDVRFVGRGSYEAA